MFVMCILGDLDHYLCSLTNNYFKGEIKMEYGILSIVPPILAMCIAIMFKKIPLALFLGIVSGQLIINGFNPLLVFPATVNLIIDVCTYAGNLKVLMFTSLMGAFVLLVKVSGGVDGFVYYLTEQNNKIKSKRMAMLLAYIIGIVIFIDGLMSIMFTGVVTRPITDKFRVSREKLAYICDSTSAPINALIPLNSWGAMLIGLISVQIASGIISGDATSLLLQSLPLQFYSIISLITVLFYILTGKDWGAMKKAEERVMSTGKLYNDGVVPLIPDDDRQKPIASISNKNNMIIPLVILVTSTFILLLITGNGNLTKGDGTMSILYSIIITLSFMCFYYSKQKIMKSSEFVQYLYQGIGSMLSLVTLLVLAFAIGETISSLETGLFLASIVEGKVPGAFGPAIIFILGAVMSFSTGTSWGTFSIVMPIAIPMAVGIDANIALTIGAVVSGGIFGDHCSPMSDTTILSSMSAGTDLYSHVRTQIPYALLSASITILLYLITGFIL